MNHRAVLLFSMETYKLSIGRDRSSVNAGKSMVDKPVFRWISELAGFQSSESIEKSDGRPHEKKREADAA
jgi:hypothetical protein